MLTGLLASARELRNPLTVGYSALFAFWLVAGEETTAAARNDALGRRIIAGLDSMGATANFALCTFAAAMVGSVLWNGGGSRLVRLLSSRARHPDWDNMIEDARKEVKRHEEYEVTTYKSPSGGKPSPFDKSHSVPSPHHATYLHQRAEERERKAAEMSFRVTLALALVPVAIALGVEGGGHWWWSLCSIPVIWLDVALMKHTTLRLVRRYQLEDLESQLERAKERLESAASSGPKRRGSDETQSQAEARYQKQLATLQEVVDARERAIKLLRDDENRPMSRLFATLEGRSAN